MESGSLKRFLCEAALSLCQRVNTRRPFRLARLPLDHFGFSCSYPANAIAALERMPKTRRPILLFAKPEQVANQTLYQLWKRRLRFSRSANLLIAYIEKTGRFTELLYTWREEPYFDKNGVTEKTTVPVSFSESERARARSQLLKLGIDPNKPWVCLCVRELGYLTRKLGSQQSEENSYRQSTLANYEPAVAHLLEKGIQVVRMGVATKQRLSNFEYHEGYIDYSQLNRSEFLDIFLVSQCYFYLGDSDGLVNVARLFKRPTVIANWIPISLANTARRNAILLFKPIALQSNGHTASFFDLATNNQSELLTSSQYAEQGLVPKENTPDEIQDAVRTMTLSLEGSELPETPHASAIRRELRLREPLKAYLPQFDRIDANRLSAPSNETLSKLFRVCQSGELARAAQIARHALVGLERLAWLARIRSLACQWTESLPAIANAVSLPLCFAKAPDTDPASLSPLESRKPSYLKSPRRRALDSTREKRTYTIAYLSFDFKSHSAGFPLLPLLERHTQPDFSVIALCLGPALPFSSEYRQLNLSGLTIEHQSRLLSEHPIDLIINTTDHLPESSAELLSQVSEPKVVSAWGYYPVFDERINDAVLVDACLERSLPPNANLRVLKIPSYHMQRLPVGSASEATASLDPKPIRIGAFNNPYKLDQGLFDAWLEILQSAPNSVLSLPETNRYAERRLRRYASSQGVSADRLQFLPRVPRNLHLKRLRNYHLLLDNPYMGSGGMLFDAVEAGVPFVSLAGNLMFNRAGSSILNALSLNQLLAADTREYKKLAMELISDPLKADAVRFEIAGARSRYASTLFDQHFSAYETALKRFISEPCLHTA